MADEDFKNALKDLGVDDDDGEKPEEPTEETEPEAKPQETKKDKKMARGKGGRRTYSEIPIQEVDKAIEKGATEVLLRILRQTASGQLGTCIPRLTKPIRELKSGEFEQFLDTYCGGGTFLCEAKDPITEELLFDRFRVTIPGAPKDPKRTMGGMGVFAGQPPMPGGYGGGWPPQQPAMPGAGGFAAVPSGQSMMPTQIPPGIARPSMDPSTGQMSLPPQEEIPKIYRSYPAMDQWQIYYGQLQAKGQLPQGASIHSDAMAMGFNNTLQLQLAQEQRRTAQLQEKLEANERDARKDIEALSRQLSEMREQLVRRESDAKIEALEARLQAMSAGPKTDYASLAAALVPFGVQWLKSSQESQVTQIKTSQEQTQALLTTLMKPQKSDTDWAKILAAASPLLIEGLKLMNPANKAQAQAEQDEMKLMMVKMLIDLIQQQAGPEPPAWFPVIEAVLESISEAFSGSGGPQLPGAPKGLPSGQAQQPQAGQGGGPARQTPNENEEQVWASFSQIDAQAAQLTKAVWDALPRELGFHTHEWRILLFNIHRRHEVEELVGELLTHLAQCQKFMMLPAPLQKVFESPRDAIEPLFEQLPIYKFDKAYTEQLIDHLVGRLNEHRPTAAASNGQQSAVAHAEGHGVIEIDERAAGEAEAEEGEEEDVESEEQEGSDDEEGAEAFFPGGA